MHVSSKRVNDWNYFLKPFTVFSSSVQMTCSKCFYLSGGLYWLSNLINKASEICLLFIFLGLLGFARAGKLPFSGTIFPRHCSAFLLFLMESDEHSQGTRCYPLASLQQKVKKKIGSQLWQLTVGESTAGGGWELRINFSDFTLQPKEYASLITIAHAVKCSFTWSASLTVKSF